MKAKRVIIGKKSMPQVVSSVKRGKFRHQLVVTEEMNPETGLPLMKRKRPIGKNPRNKKGVGLIPAKKGEVRNPWGRAGKDGRGGLPPQVKQMLQPIGKTLQKYAQLECVDPAFVKKFGPGIPIHEAIALTTLSAAMRNDYHARDFYADRTEGKVVTPILVNDGSIHVTISGIQEAEHVVIPSEDVVEEDGTA